MGIYREKDRSGKFRHVVSKRWPDGSRFRRYFENATSAKRMLARIEESMAMGTWRDLRDELTLGFDKNTLTIEQLAEQYMSEYCEVRNKRPDFKKQAIKPIKRSLGNIRIGELRRSHVHQFVARRSKVVAPATVNRNVAVLKNMMTFALERELIEVHPLLRFRMLPEEKRALRVMTLEEERRLVECVDDPVVGAYVAILGETGLRMSEGLNLRWEHIDTGQQLVSVENTKSGRPRYVPLSDYALEWLNSLIRIVGAEHVFTRLNGTRVRDPRYFFFKAREKAKLDWVGFHDMRHFRATQWVMRGVDLRTVQELLGHSCITTTMRYAHFASSHAMRSVRKVQQSEAQDAALERATNGRHSRG